jgi:hypothetical protein
MTGRELAVLRLFRSCQQSGQLLFVYNRKDLAIEADI